MKYSVTVKFIAIVICAAMLTGAVASAVGLGALGASGILAGKTVEQLQAENLDDKLHWYAAGIVSAWAAGEYGGLPEKEVQDKMDSYQGGVFHYDSVYITILDDDGEVLYTDYKDQEVTKTFTLTLTNVFYQKFLGYVHWDESDEDTEDETQPMFSGREHFAVDSDGREYSYTTEKINRINVSVRLAPFATEDEPEWELLTQVEARKAELPWILGGCLFVFAIFAVYLCCAAGHKPGREEIRAGGLNRLPLELYFGAVIGSLVFAVWILDDGGVARLLIRLPWKPMLYCLTAGGFLVCLVFVGFCFAFVAQLKTPGAFWWWNSLCGRCLRLAMWILKKGAPIVGDMIVGSIKLAKRIVVAMLKVAGALLNLAWNIWKKIWAVVLKYIRRTLRWLEHFFSLLPLTWQWLLVGMGMILTILMAYTWDYRNRAENVLVGGAICVAIVVYGAECFGTLLNAVRKLRGGDLSAKVDNKYLVGSFREFAEELNGLADVAMVAAQKQLKSERMKTELITNVSHDIKTPLTSIINYVDLLEKPHTPEEERTYLEVLSRQSQRMKKLIEDLMEMSKASTGNIPVEITRIDAVEAVNQALGEFADKLTAAGLTPVFHRPEEDLYLLADGRLLWRAVSNILSNAVKYALPGTRLYIDLSAMDDKAVISFKNVSGAELNISADELMERFVRGDSSRNTEGSGLGLNIAKSLMELQKGQLELLVDGDLFKVTLVFPKAE